MWLLWEWWGGGGGLKKLVPFLLSPEEEDESLEARSYKALKVKFWNTRGFLKIASLLQNLGLDPQKRFDPWLNLPSYGLVRVIFCAIVWISGDM